MGRSTIQDSRDICTCAESVNRRSYVNTHVFAVCVRDLQGDIGIDSRERQTCEHKSNGKCWAISFLAKLTRNYPPSQTAETSTSQPQHDRGKGAAKGKDHRSASQVSPPQARGKAQYCWVATLPRIASRRHRTFIAKQGLRRLTCRHLHGLEMPVSHLSPGIGIRLLQALLSPLVVVRPPVARTCSSSFGAGQAGVNAEPVP